MAGIVGLTELQHTNGTSAATIDASGRILTPARPSFHARKSSSSGSEGFTGVVVFDEEDFDERKRRRNFKAKRGIEKCYPRVFTSLFFTNALTSSTNFSCSTHGFPISRPRAHTYPFNEFISKGAPASKSNLVDGKCAP